MSAFRARGHVYIGLVTWTLALRASTARKGDDICEALAGFYGVNLQCSLEAYVKGSGALRRGGAANG